MGKLDIPNKAFLIECHSLETSSDVNNSIVLLTQDDVLRKFGTKRKKSALLLTDVARCMALAGKTLKKYPLP